MNRKLAASLEAKILEWLDGMADQDVEELDIWWSNSNMAKVMTTAAVAVFDAYILGQRVQVENSDE
jgi:hypothetical protein